MEFTNSNKENLKENLKQMINENVTIFNTCIKNWYIKNFSDKLEKGEFIGCCNDEELELLIECYNIISSKKKLTTTIDEKLVEAIIAYYYEVQVLEYYVQGSKDEKYINIVNEGKKKINNGVVFIFKDDNGNYYTCSFGDMIKNEDYIKVKNINNGIMYYVKNGDRKADPYIYIDNKGQHKAISDQYMNCFEFLSKETKNILNEITISDEPWASEIRQKILNMNPKPFVSGGRKKKTKKNNRFFKKMKKTSRKKVKKTQRNRKYKLKNKLKK